MALGAWLAGLTWKQCGGGLLSIAAVVLTLWIGFNDVKNPGTLAVFAAVAQFGSAWLFAQHRTAEPGHAKTIVRQISDMRDRLAGLVGLIENIQEQQPKANLTELRTTLGRVNVETTYLAEDCERVLKSWGDFDPGTLRALEQESLNGAPRNDPSNGEGA